MTNLNDINLDGYAVVWFDPNDDDKPKICKPSEGPVRIDGFNYAIYNTAANAAVEFLKWAGRGEYGILPVRSLVEEKVVTTTVFKDGVL